MKGHEDTIHLVRVLYVDPSITVLPFKPLRTVVLDNLPLDLKVLMDEGEWKIDLSILQPCLDGIIAVDDAVDLLVLVKR